MPRWLAMSLLLLSPLLILGLTALVLKITSDFRRSFGAVNPTPVGAVAVAAAFLALHAGYAAAPFLLTGGRRTLALCLTTPPAILASLLVLGLIATNGLRPGAVGQTAAGFAVSLVLFVVAYWAPIAGLVWSR